jgi:hypothetical protein
VTNFDLLKEAYLIVDQQRSLKLSEWRHCAAGKLANHPSFSAKTGLRLNGWTPTLDKDGRTYDEYSALAQVFDIPWEEAFDLFCSREHGSPYDPPVKMSRLGKVVPPTCKALWKARMRNFFKVHGIPLVQDRKPAQQQAAVA